MMRMDEIRKLLHDIDQLLYTADAGISDDSAQRALQMLQAAYGYALSNQLRFGAIYSRFIEFHCLVQDFDSAIEYIRLYRDDCADSEERMVETPLKIAVLLNHAMIARRPDVWKLAVARLGSDHIDEGLLPSFLSCIELEISMGQIDDASNIGESSGSNA